MPERTKGLVCKTSKAQANRGFESLSQLQNMKTFKDYLVEAEQEKVYYRGTNNPDEEMLVRNRTLRASVNQVTKQPEKGISASDVPSVGEYFKYLYVLTGKEVGEGSDGEPLLDPSSVSFVRWVKQP